MNCTRCDGWGYINTHQVPEHVRHVACKTNVIEVFERWIKEQTEPHDVQVCDCCGDGEGWYGVPGEHYSRDDPPGDRGPYTYNGGYCECH